MSLLTLALVAMIICVFIFFGLVVFLGAPYVPSHKKDVKRIFAYLGIGADDLVVDLGSGDGLVLRAAAQYGAKAVGYELNPVLALIARLLSIGRPTVRTFVRNAWTARFPKETTLVYAFTVNRDEAKVTKLLQKEANRLQKPLRLICYGSPFKRVVATETFEAYHIYLFKPLQ